MKSLWMILPVLSLIAHSALSVEEAPACCPAAPFNVPVVNADQTVIIIWDAANKTQHFIRKASFKSDSDDFGFIIPSPSQPALEESGNDAFPYLFKVTEPEVIQKSRPGGGFGCGCGARSTDKDKSMDKSKDKAAEVPPKVNVIEEKLVAGFNAVVLEARSAEALVDWLKEKGYANSPEIQAWAKPYVEAGWKFTALKVAKDKTATESKSVTAAALRLTFKTDHPLFPYREPDSTKSAAALDAKSRLLRIYFLAWAKYRGSFSKEVPWTGKIVWANKLSDEQRTQTLALLKLPADTGPATYWLTEFEDNWPYQIAPGDVTFSPALDNTPLKRRPHIVYVAAPGRPDIMACAIVPMLLMPTLMRLRRPLKSAN